ncbi:MAG: TolC family protein [Planctomycetota bacterium]|jgi:cobalt-zinc-cadmium efflux system outer membrane protein
MMTRRRWCFAVALSGLAILAACVGGSRTRELGLLELDVNTTRPDGARPARTTAGTTGTTGTTGLESGAQAAAAEQSGRITLAQVRARILARANLELAAQAMRVAESRASEAQDELWPNPYVLVRKRRVDDFDVIDSGFLEIEFGQPFELGGKRAARVAQARATTQLAEEKVRALTFQTLRDAELQYCRVLRLDSDLSEARREVTVAATLERLAVMLHEAGKRGRMAMLRFQAMAEDARLTVADLERRHQQACRVFDELLGMPLGSVKGVTGELAQAALAPIDRDAARAALERHPRLLVARRSAAAATHAVQSADASAWSDLTVAVAYEHDDDLEEDFVGLLFQLPLPLWNRNQGDREQARASLQRARKTEAAETLRLAVELETALLAYDRARDRAVGYARGIIARLEESSRLAGSAYEAGRLSHVEVLDAELALIRARRARLEYLEDQALAAAEIRYLAAAIVP